MQEQKYLTSLTFFVERLNLIGPYVIGLILIIFILYRTKSPFFFLYRIQALIGGATAFNNERLQKQWKSYSDKNHLNLWFGLGLKSSRAMHRLTAWLHRHKIALDEIAWSVPYFDTNRLSFSFPSKGVLRFRKISIPLAATAFVLGGAIFTIPDSALLWVKKTGTLFWVSDGYAYSPTNLPITALGYESGWKIDNDYCLFMDDVAPLDEQWDKDVICYLVLGNRRDYIDDAVQSQKHLGVYLIILSIVLATVGLYFRCRMMHARQLAARVASGNSRHAHKMTAPANPVT